MFSAIRLIISAGRRMASPRAPGYHAFLEGVAVIAHGATRVLAIRVVRIRVPDESMASGDVPLSER
jgi:hypothetical protein